MTWRAQTTGRFYDPGEGQVVYFDLASGDTHLLSDVAAHLLRLLQPKPLSLEELATHFDEGSPEETASALHVVLDELVALNILEPV